MISKNNGKEHLLYLKISKQITFVTIFKKLFKYHIVWKGLLVINKNVHVKVKTQLTSLKSIEL